MIHRGLGLSLPSTPRSLSYKTNPENQKESRRPECNTAGRHTRSVFWRCTACAEPWKRATYGGMMHFVAKNVPLGEIACQVGKARLLYGPVTYGKEIPQHGLWPIPYLPTHLPVWRQPFACRGLFWRYLRRGKTVCGKLSEQIWPFSRRSAPPTYNPKIEDSLQLASIFTFR